MGNFFKTKEAQPATSQQASGYSALPQWAKNAYEQQYDPGIQQYFGSQQSQNPTAPLHQFQTSALNTHGQGIQGLQQDIGQYMNPYQQHVTNQINQGYEQNRNNLLGQAQQFGGVGALKSSSLGTQLGQNTMNQQNALQGANYQNYNQALGLRENLLNNQYNAGAQYQQQSQNEQNGLLMRLQSLGQLLGMIPQSSTGSSFGGRAEGPSPFAKAVAGVQAVANVGRSFSGAPGGGGGGTTF